MIVLDPNLPETTISWIYQNFKQPLLADSINKITRLRNGISALDTLVLNADESEFITDIRITDRQSAEKCATALLNLGISNVFIYDAEIGFLYQTQTSSFYFPVTLSKVLNTNGVGAAALAAIIYARRTKLNTSQTAEVTRIAAQTTMTTYLNVSENMTPQFLQDQLSH
nr:PfkB family carbohydrate kinase [Levilactobacillus brevis]